MHGAISAHELAIRTWPPEERLVALVSGYFDDSLASGDVWVVAGYAGTINQWELLERLWNEALVRHGVPYFHMREMADPKGPFAKWHPPQDHKDEVLAFLSDLVAAIRKSRLKMFGSAVWTSDLDRFNAEHGVSIEPYPLAAYACLSQVAFEYQLPVTAIFDRVEKIQSKLRRAWQYIRTEPLWPELCDNIATMPLQKTVTSRQVPGMQAADFIAWESRKAYLQMREWQLLPDRQMGDREQQLKHYVQWTREMTGNDPKLRKSLDALLTGADVHAVVWDLDQLKSTHAARNGAWPSQAA